MTSSRDVLNDELDRLLRRKGELIRELEIIDRQVKDIRKYKGELRKDPTTGEARGGRENYMVRASYLKPMIDYYLSLGNLQYILAMNSNVSAKTIRGIRRGDREFVSLTTADRLTTEMGIGDLLGTDELPIEANPFGNGRPPSHYYED